MHNVVGVYFGIKTISIVETKNRKIANIREIPREVISAGELEDKVPEEVKLAEFLKNELKEAGIETKDAAITLPGRELIIRSFEMALLPREELLTAVDFEAKKYIPFKTEDLISDFQIKLDKRAKRNLVLFFSIRKETLDKYTSLTDQIGIKIINNNIEYAAFSLLRLLDLTGKKKKGIFGIIDIDLKEETNFTVLEEGFPLFSRDINLRLETEDKGLASPEDSSFLDRLKNEVRISLDYYRRKFPSKPMNKLIAIIDQTYKYKDDLEALAQELGLSIEFIDIFKYVSSQTQLISMSSIKAYSVSLTSSIKMPLRLNLLSAREKLSKISEAGATLEVALPSPSVRPDYRFILVGLFIIILSFILGLFQRLPLEKEIREILNSQTKLDTLMSKKSYEQLKTVYDKYDEKLQTLDTRVKGELYLTEILNIIPSALPEGAWLTSLSFERSTWGEVKLAILGQVFLGDRNKEFEAVDRIANNLKANPVLLKTFEEIDITSLDRTKVKNWEVTNFIISCKTEKYGTKKSSKYKK